MAQYFDLVIRCPACIADGKDGKVPAPWYHHSCGGGLQIGDDANYRCKRCNVSSHVQNWRYACEAHESDFRPTSSAHLANAVSTAGQITSIAGRQWLLTFLQNLGDW
ncbi:hypothetical protein F4553_003103 [Allocatelliglobosispora scoriae]|uniref:Uncharacterized protein n=1 Tax=Allocatelliglobosispora scoriae TaxID=643052 RepID=A0A841BN79_9ACTN|nr:hypothetical protein [Allocatelliglobosispora scoriae]MBB5869724.1 hypothetical protein [Allocatelliglobosispora scoriae]